MNFGDELTVRCCRSHCQQLHQAGSEVAWSEKFKNNAFPIAKELREQTCSKSVPDIDTRQSNEATKKLTKADRVSMKLF